MPLIYVTGPSGAGKSTVRNELIKRGYEAHDTDEDGMSAWYDNQRLRQLNVQKKKTDPPTGIKNMTTACLPSECRRLRISHLSLVQFLSLNITSV
jgi:tRNA uridine 5-carbamoylmethylation protein Kti12